MKPLTTTPEREAYIRELFNYIPELFAEIDALRKALADRQRYIDGCKETLTEDGIAHHGLLAVMIKHTVEQLTQSRALNTELWHALESLFALVNGECPSLLEDDHHYVIVTEALAHYREQEKGV